MKTFTPEPPPETNGEPALTPLAEDTLALEFAKRHAEAFRYVAAWSRWMQFDGCRWIEDHTLKAVDLAREVARAATDRCDNDTRAAAVASRKVILSIEGLARSDRRIAATVEQWDADGYLLNTPGGAVDLRTGGMMESRRDHYCTKVTTVAPGGECPIWEKFLDRIFKGDAAMIAYAQRFCGYALTGDVSEHAFAYGHGTGANGKSVFLDTIAYVMGDYATTAPVETFTASANDKHPTELARLRGARLVTASETEKGRRWAESRIKQLTGGDKVAARFMRQDFFEFFPTFKLVVIGNHKPHLRTVDEAIKRRLHLWPFEVTIPPGERDPGLSEKLKGEAAGILQWMIRGCLDWQRSRLDPPPAVQAATAAYFEAEDSFGAWLDECTAPQPQHRETSSNLFASWSKWATENGEEVGSQKVFSAELERRGFTKTKSGAIYFQGIWIRPAPVGASDGYGQP